MHQNLPKYRDPEHLTDSEDEVHPNIESKSFKRFVREEQRKRLDHLKSKPTLTPEEEKEMYTLEYKFLPIAIVDEERTSFRYNKSENTDDEESDYSDEIIHLFHNSEIEDVMLYLDRKQINLAGLLDQLYLNVSMHIKDGNDELGYEFCRLGQIIKWALEYGRGYLQKIKGIGEDKMKTIYAEHYELSKQAILKECS